MGTKPKAKQGQDEQDAGGAKEQINRPQNRTNTKQTKCERTLNCDEQQKIAVRWALGNEVLCQMRSLFPPLTSQFSQLDRRTTKIFEELPQSVLRRKRKVKVYTYITLLIKLDHLENSTSLKIPLLFE